MSLQTEIGVKSLQLKIGSKLYTLFGQSLAGTRTCIIIPEIHMCFDMGYCPNKAVSQEFVAISHGHGDHIGSLHLHAFNRRLIGVPTGTYFMPKTCVENFNVAHDAFKCMNRHVTFGKDDISWLTRRYNINDNVFQKTKYYNKLSIQSFDTIHGVPSLAYCIYEDKTALKAEYNHLKGNGKEINKLVKEGINVNESISSPIIAFTGDTIIDGVIKHHDLMCVKILIIECTYIKDCDTVEQAIQRGHIHIKQIIENCDKFKNEYLVLTHLSSKYSNDDVINAEKVLQTNLGDKFNNNGTKICIFDTRIL